MKSSLSFALFLVVSALSGFVALISICWSSGAFHQTMPWRVVVAMLGFRGFLIGLPYGVYYLYKQRWVLQFPIVQVFLVISKKKGLKFLHF